MKHLGLLGVLNVNSVLRSNFSPFTQYYGSAWPSCSGGKTEVLKACNLSVCCWVPALLLISTFLLLFLWNFTIKSQSAKEMLFWAGKNTCCGIPSAAAARSSHLQRSVVSQVCSEWYVGIFPCLQQPQL